MLKKIYFVIAAVLDGAIIAFFVLAVISSSISKDDLLILGAFLSASFLLMAISLSCIRKLKEGKEKLVRNSLLMKLSVIFLCIPFAFLSFADGIYAFCIFFFLGLVIAGITFKVIKRKTQPRTPAAPLKEEKYSFRYKGKWEWDAAADEYMRLHGIPGTLDLSEEQKDLIYGYTATPFSYMFYWLAVNGHLSGSFMDEFGKDGLIEDMLSKKCTPAETLGRLDHYFGSEYLKEDIVPFFRAYYDTQGRFGIRPNYVFDYYEALGEVEDRYYCIDFSWEVCDALDKKIEERYSEWKRDFGREEGTSQYENESAGRELHSELFGSDLEIHLSGTKYMGFPKDYSNSCLEMLDGLAERQLWKLERFFEREYGKAEDPYVTRIETFRPDSLYIMEPKEAGDVVFAVSGEAVFEPEHGISFTVRNGIVLDWAFASDIEDPYNSENIRNYENEPSFDISAVKSIEDAEFYLQMGELVRVKLLPEMPCCSAKGEEEYVYLTPAALKEKEKYERYIRNIRSFSGIRDLEMVFVPEYYKDSDGKALSVVPGDIFIRTADASKKVKAFFRINVWN